MGKVITINKKLAFQMRDNQTISTAYKIKVNGEFEDVETKISRVRNDVVGQYKRYNIIFYKKFKIDGAVYGKAFESVLRKYNISLLVNDYKKFVFSLGMARGVIPRASLKKLKMGTDIQCIEVGVDLIDAIPVILYNIPGLEVNSGWFTRLGTQLQNALLQGEGVNDNEEWKKFRDLNGSKLTNVTFKVYDEEFTNGYILMSLSSRGFIHTNSGISDSKYIKIAEEIVNVLDENNALIYEKVENNEDEDEDELADDFIEKLDFIQNEEYFIENLEEIQV